MKVDKQNRDQMIFYMKLFYVEKKYLIVCLMLQQPWILRDLLAKLCLMELQKLYAGKEIGGY
jgi:hypothetical protein